VVSQLTIFDSKMNNKKRIYILAWPVITYCLAKKT